MPSFSIPLSGLTASSSALSTTANNLANLNTIGYKDEQIQFADLFYQDFGTNGAGDPIQQGAGVTVSSKPSDFTQGNVTPTGVSTDVAVMGSGFFVVQKNGAQSYTRAGNFEVGTDNLLETAAGQQVLGYPAINGVVSTGQGLGPLALGAGTISPATVTSKLQMTSNLDATAAVGTVYAAPQATIYDSLGASHNITITYTKTATNTWSYSVSIPAADLNPISGVPQTGILETGTLTFDGNGTLISDTQGSGSAQAPPANITGIAITGLADGASNMTFDWNVLNGTTPVVSQMAGANSTSSIQQDGRGSGTLVNFSIGSDGTITGSFSNGKTATIGQIALASFADEQGLSHQGNNDFTPTLASGQPTIGGPGTGGLGTISGGALEQSNVDIASEFARLIIAQRSYEANARVVTTFDQVAQATIALKQ
ncbi:MAG: flagellar hook protein FlgE [Acidobacteriia bacterium]|nr:flagellar hook protein FlgE [Terriglobia bacterium]